MMRKLLARVYSDKQEDILAICLQITNFASFIACLIVIYLYVRYKSIRSLATRLLYWISISGLISCIATFLSIAGSLDVGILCTMQAFLLQIGSMASLLWSTVITVVIYKVLIKSNNSYLFFNDIDKWWIKMHIIIWSITIITAIIPLFISDAYGPTGGTCWIIQHLSIHQWLRYLLYYIPWFICIVIMIILSFKVTKYAFSAQYIQDIVSNKNEKNGNENINIFRIIRTIWYYPLIVLGFMLFFAIRRADELIRGESAIFAFAVLSIIAGYSRQIPNTLIFCFTPNVKAVIYSQTKQDTNSDDSHLETVNMKQTDDNTQTNNVEITI